MLGGKEIEAYEKPNRPKYCEEMKQVYTDFLKYKNENNVWFIILSVEEGLHGIVSCTACGQQVNHFQKDSIYRHPTLKVLICKVCGKQFYSLYCLGFFFFV